MLATQHRPDSSPISRGNREGPARLKRALALLRLTWVAFLLELPSAALSGAEPYVPTEYHLKAAQLFTIAKFVDWPEQTFENESSPFVIGVLGKDPFGSDLEVIVKDRKLHGRPITVKRSDDVKQLLNCQILFISSSEERRLRQILEEIKGKPILTAGDMPRFPESGGILYFTLEERKVRFEINRSAASSASLGFSAQLLRLATKIHGNPP